MENILKKVQCDVEETDLSFLDEAKKRAGSIAVRKTAFVQEKGVRSELSYKKIKAKSGELMYHYHLCCRNLAEFQNQAEELEILLKEEKLHLDRFGVSIDYAMALPETIREQNRRGDALYFAEQEDWNILGIYPEMQPHLGDNMIGSPASYSLVQKALSAGVTTIGNVSQFFGWDYPEYTDVKQRTKSTLQAIALMAEKKKDGALIHSNLDDGYGDKAGDLGLLIGCALLEKYIIETLMGAKIAHSFGDMFYSPMKRLVFLSALKQIHGQEMVGSMIFANKLGRNKKKIELNTAHMSEHLLFDMAGKYIYQKGQAVTTMANQGLTSQVSSREIIQTLEYARELEGYLPHVVDTIDFEKIDNTAKKVVYRGKLFFEAVLEYLGGFIDVENPYAMLLAVKEIGIKYLTERFERKQDTEIIIADYNLYEH